MSHKKLVVFDFDDTIVKTTKHICTCYSAVTGDELTNGDFLAEFVWDNAPRYKDLFRSIITAIQDDPSKLEFMEGFGKFILKVDKLINYDIVILSKRTGIKQVRDFMNKSFPDIKIEYAFVKKVEDKVTMMERFHDFYSKIYLFEDRLDVMQDDMIDYCKHIYMPNRAWNKYQSDEIENMSKFDSYEEFLSETGMITIF